MRISKLLFPNNFKYVLYASLVMVILMFVDSLGLPVDKLGIIPLNQYRLTGILTAPFVHDSWSHLSGNLVGLFICSYLASRLPKFETASLSIMLLTGLFVWLFAGSGNHIGASGIVMGYYGFLIGLAFFQRNLLSVISLALLAAATYYANINFLGTLFDFSENISSESHLFGFLSGVFTAYFLRVKKQKNSKPQKYSNKE
ncbi:rhomboid family intramembrane serine protease [Pseudoalteromonas luteoviolacea]|uniref:rhomboid family intramembrane serine protease n=1 Tax=Pseudoalteromonas luteoviolacea TaxID=43657 RepID=UPI001F3A86DA|nr:rhomboid family intramembrane serine protease [Pseudoalteromonas luteoviolacea]MCF6442527.1 rhomboid family intramembrane serine protease [Pseudoalteromonas luteoviolacea]